MLKKSNATPYTIIDKTNIHTPDPGLPSPNNPKRNTHASIAINITRLIPKCFNAKGISRIHNVSETCDKDINALACCTPKVFAYSGILSKLLRKGLANPLVICKETPNNIENTKNIAIFLRLNSKST